MSLEVPGELCSRNRDLHARRFLHRPSNYRELPDMEPILAITLVSLGVFAAAVVGRIAGSMDRDVPRLTVADIQARLAAEPPRTYVPVSRRW
ncbi:hypothetical protein AB0N05_30510 [Nocardia sp. NPDC051030]|uniref:hypothetical protein n=1 Tax=Nocardia sp. NPDC051030 TaxID=3155162 RepID=UPI00341D44B3